MFNIALIVWGAQHSNIDLTNGFEGVITYFYKQQQMDEVFCKSPFYLQFHLVLQVAQKLHTAIWFLHFLYKKWVVLAACPCKSCYHNAWVLLGHFYAVANAFWMCIAVHAPLIILSKRPIFHNLHTSNLLNKDLASSKSFRKERKKCQGSILDCAI